MPPLTQEAPLAEPKTKAALRARPGLVRPSLALPREAANAWLRRNPDLCRRLPRSSPAPLGMGRTARPVRIGAIGRRGWRALSTGLKLAVPLFLAYGLLFNFSVVRGSSMSPGIRDGDRILIDHLSYVFQDVERGDIVVLQYPLDPSLDYIKRVIGLPGDEIRITHGRVFVNGDPLAEPYVAQQDPGTDIATRVEPESYFVLGDNRPHSSDSREFGFVPRVYLRGRVDLRVWPPSRAGTLE